MWQRLTNSIRDHFSQVDSLVYRIQPPLPYVTSDLPIRMMDKQHERFVRLGVHCYRRASVFVTGEWIRKAHELNMFDSNAYIDTHGGGKAMTKSGHQQRTTIPPLSTLDDTQRTHIPNYEIRMENGRTRCYTPFTAQVDPKWATPQNLKQVQMKEDIINAYNVTTLGPYSFMAFITNSWSAKHIEKAHNTVDMGRSILMNTHKGRRKTIQFSNFRLRRPSAKELMRKKRLRGGYSYSILKKNHVMKRIDNKCIY
ncbi:hypothetical protein V5O48_015309 [Marasmius crinis-equi]|uniref:Uncharacterized protein n=1 Tax=Marasmius crinis-equi TaxID=585013 RepID=A0ABR3EV64_9AGAR